MEDVNLLVSLSERSTFDVAGSDTWRRFPLTNEAFYFFARTRYADRKQQKEHTKKSGHHDNNEDLRRTEATILSWNGR